MKEIYSYFGFCKSDVVGNTNELLISIPITITRV